MVVYDFKNVGKLKKLKHSDEVLPKHADKIDNVKNGVFKDFKYDSYKDTPPYPNESIRTLQELIKLIGINSNEDFIYSMDRITDMFRELCSELNVELEEDKIESLIEDAGGIILDLKYHYNRPRPNLVAKLYGLELDENRLHLDTADSPSFPSGHATQGTLIGNYFANKYPNHSIRFKKLGRDIGKSRVNAKVHYPSDIVIGERLGNAMFQYLKENNLL
jgi:acid phosphatase (class A)